MTSEEKWLQTLDNQIWVRKEDRFGRIHSFPAGGQTPLSKKVKECILNLIKTRELPCVMHSGPYGGLSFSVWKYIEAPGAPPDYLISLDERHLFGERIGWHSRFDFISQFTHTDRNRELCRLRQLPFPERRSYYEY